MRNQAMLYRRMPCCHRPECPSAQDSAHGAARVVASHPEQGWVLLCNGVVAFDDTASSFPTAGLSRRTVRVAGTGGRSAMPPDLR